MRALDPRRSLLTSTRCPFPRSALCLLLLVFALRDARARSALRGEETADQSAIPFVGTTSEKLEDVARVDASPESARAKPDGPGPSDGERIASEELEAPRIDEGGSRDPVEFLVPKGVKKIEELKREDEDASVAKKRRRNDVAAVARPEVLDVQDEGIRRFDARVDPEGSAAGTIVVPAEKRGYEEQEQSAESVEQSDRSKETIPEYFRKSGEIEDDGEGESEAERSDESSRSAESEEYRVSRGHRSPVEGQDKGKRKSSTVYLNAEEKKIPDGEQQSIVDGQIKKLISIRDDAARKPDKMDEAEVLDGKKDAGLDGVTFARENLQDPSKSKVKDSDVTDSRADVPRSWREQAIALQERIKDKAFLTRLREQASPVLPEIPRLTDVQLLETLERIVASKKPEPLEVSYVAGLKDLGLTETQVRIFACAERLLPSQERQTFSEKLSECIRGLNVLNCLRIFVWPIVQSNLPASVSETLANLPIEVNVFDLFQANRQKTARAQDLNRYRLLTPDLVVYNILQEALETYPSDETLISYVDPRNETLKELISVDQMYILQMAEKFLPQTMRQDYSDKMFSCVRRFEYYSCVKYFAWPLIKQYFPALPAFPDYQNWYPIVELSPQYPIFPFPSFSEDVGELPEVVDADATRSKKPRPEGIIIEALRNTLNEQQTVPAALSFLDRSSDTTVHLMPEDQLLAINMAEQLIPVSHRLEFVQKTVRCMKEYNYLTCFKYSTWPTVKHYAPTLPDISSLLPDFLAPGLSNGYLSEIPTYSGYYWPVFGGDAQKDTVIPEYFAENRANQPPLSSDQLEARVLEILQGLRGSAETTVQLKSGIFKVNSVAKATLTDNQMKILRLAESLVPESAQPNLDAEVLAHLEKHSFVDSVRRVIWPTLAKYVPLIPEFPTEGIATVSTDPGIAQSLLRATDSSINSGEATRGQVSPEEDTGKQPRERVANVPLISVSGIRFVPLFTDHPEAVILNILRSLQPHSFKTGPETPSSAKNQQFLDLLNEQQANIVNIMDSLIPESIRTEFANKMITCLRGSSFLVCTRDVAWPTLTQYFPWLPSFPDFGGLVTGPPSNPPPAEPGTSSDSPALSETNVKTGQHGDTTVTITDTRFFPIFNELPESIVLNILRAVELSVPNLPEKPAATRSKEFAPYLTEQQLNILTVAESLLPVSARAEHAEKIGPCAKERNFLECTRDITWPTIAKSYPWLPSFPNFGSLQALPRVPTPSSIRFQLFLSEKGPLQGFDRQITQDSLKQKTESLLRETDKKIENLLMSALRDVPELDRSYLNIADPTAALLSKEQRNIIRLIERGVPEATRSSYVARTLQCVTRYSFIACTNSIGWPALKQSVPQLPDFSTITNLLSELPLQIPDFGQIIPDFLPDVSIPAITFPTARPSIDPRIQQAETPSLTSSVGDRAVVPAYAGQPPGVPVDLQAERVVLPDDAGKSTARPETSARRRRNAADVLDSRPDADGKIEGTDDAQTFPNITESEYLQLLVKIKGNARVSVAANDGTKSTVYVVDALSTAARNSLTADQYQILRIVQDLDDQPSGKGLASQVIQCITGLSFIRCLGIFVWPMIASNLPSLPSFGILGRSADVEDQVRRFFGMSAGDFEKRLLDRKQSIEKLLLDGYRRLAEDQFQMDAGFLRINGHGNNELGLSFSGFRQARGAKLKDNKNLPSILTIISDIMEEVLDQRPEAEKTKREKEKKERSIDDSRQAGIQFLKDNSEEYADIKRSMNDDEIITMFLDKIKTNDSASDDDQSAKKGNPEDAYNAFGVLFGAKLHDKLADALSAGSPEDSPVDPNRELDIVSLESSKTPDDRDALPLTARVAYDLDKESPGINQRQKRDFYQSLLDKPGDYLKDPSPGTPDNEDNKIVEDDGREESARPSLVIQLPRLTDEILPKKITNTVTELSRAFKSKMSQVMPGFGLILSFLLQLGLSHARAAASLAEMISNLALGSAMFGMIRDSMLGSNGHPQIKYVYDNYKSGPGVTWPSEYQTASDYRG